MNPRVILPVFVALAGCPGDDSANGLDIDRDNDGIVQRYDCDDHDADVGIAPEGEECAAEEGDTA
ncbi:MAG: hypothetical protein EXR71_08470 [Myxococcales bacterium]|nr:hypothetical protein [Myxococcales bacterium]